MRSGFLLEFFLGGVVYIGVWDYSQVFHCCIAWIGVRGNVIILLDFTSCFSEDDAPYISAK